MCKGLKEYKFESIYRFIDIIQQSVRNDVDFWNYNEDEFIKSAISFQKNTLLHIYAESTLLNHYHNDLKKNGDCIEESDIDNWIELFKTYNIYYDEKQNIDFEDDEYAIKWFETNEMSFEDLFGVISNEIVHILFDDKNFLKDFNKLVIKSLSEKEIPSRYLTDKGTIKRCNIPEWVKRAVFYRDKGRCVFCNKDLTGIISVLNSSNFDHILPLDKMGINDICNIQLCCETCNKSKGAKEIYPNYKYESRW